MPVSYEKIKIRSVMPAFVSGSYDSTPKIRPNSQVVFNCGWGACHASAILPDFGGKNQNQKEIRKLRKIEV
jgi:hypothetical protein